MNSEIISFEIMNSSFQKSCRLDKSRIIFKNFSQKEKNQNKQSKENWKKLPNYIFKMFLRRNFAKNLKFIGIIDYQSINQL